MRRLLAFCLLLTFALSSSPAPTYAQDTAKCDPAPLFDQASTLKASGDAKQDIANLSKFADAVRQTNIACNGFRFEGKGNKPIGTIELPAGVWLATVTTKGYFIMKAKILEGECEYDDYPLDEYAVFNIGSGEGDEGAAVVIESKGCRVLLTTENVSAAWTLTFESVS